VNVDPSKDTFVPFLVVLVHFHCFLDLFLLSVEVRVVLFDALLAADDWVALRLRLGEFSDGGWLLQTLGYESLAVDAGFY
jgi:hypothetical protein